MNHKQLAEDHYETSQHVTNGDIATRHVVRANYHATMALLEAIEPIAPRITVENSLSLDELKAEWESESIRTLREGRAR